MGLSKQPLWNEWIEGYTKFLIAAGRPDTTIGLRVDQLRHLADHMTVGPDEIDTGDLVNWFAAQGWASETRRSYRSAARGFYRWAHKNGLIDSDPSADLPMVAQRRPLPHPVPDDVWEQARDNAEPRVALMLRLAAEAGLRRAEIAKIHADDLIDAADGPALLVHGKGGHDRVVPLSAELGAAIIAQACGGWLFPGSDEGHLSPEWVGDLCGEALPGKWTLHGLRHRFATRAYWGSKDLRAVQELLGHSSPVITQRYVAVNPASLRSTMMAAAGPVGRFAAAVGLVTALLFMCAADEHCGPGPVVSPTVAAAAHWCRG